MRTRLAAEVQDPTTEVGQALYGEIPKQVQAAVQANPDIAQKAAEAAAALSAGDLLDPYLKTADASAFIASQTATGKVLVLGTSIAAGAGATSAANAYPGRVAANLQSILGQAFTVIPAGVSGNTTAQMLARLPQLLAQHRPTFVTIEASINDARVDLAIPSSATVANLRKMMALTRLAGAQPVLLTAAPMDPVWWNMAAYDYTSPSKAKATNALTVAMAAEQRVPVVPIFERMLDRVGVLADGLHPNNAGHDIWGKAVAEVIASQTVTDSRTVRVLDTFERADASTLGVATDGKTWDAPHQGAWSIVAGEARAAAGTYPKALIDAGTPNVAVKAIMAASTSELAVIARAVDTANFYAAEVVPNQGGAGSDKIYLYRCIAGAYTAIANGLPLGPTGTVKEGASLTLSVDGTHLSIAIDDAIVWAVTDTNGGALNAGTKVGLWSASSARAESLIATT